MRHTLNAISEEIVTYSATLLAEPDLLNVPDPQKQIEVQLVDFVSNIDYLRKNALCACRTFIFNRILKKAFREVYYFAPLEWI